MLTVILVLVGIYVAIYVLGCIAQLFLGMLRVATKSTAAKPERFPRNPQTIWHK